MGRRKLSWTVCRCEVEKRSALRAKTVSAQAGRALTPSCTHSHSAPAGAQRGQHRPHGAALEHGTTERHSQVRLQFVAARQNESNGENIVTHARKGAILQGKLAQRTVIRVKMPAAMLSLREPGTAAAN